MWQKVTTWLLRLAQKRCSFSLGFLECSLRRSLPCCVLPLRPSHHVPYTYVLAFVVPAIPAEHQRVREEAISAVRGPPPLMAQSAHLRPQYPSVPFSLYPYRFWGLNKNNCCFTPIRVWFSWRGAGRTYKLWVPLWNLYICRGMSPLLSKPIRPALLEYDIKSHSEDDIF